MELPEYVTKPYIKAYLVQDILNAFAMIVVFSVYFNMAMVAINLKQTVFASIIAAMFFILVLADLILTYLSKSKERFVIYKDRIEHHHKKGVNVAKLHELEGVEYKQYVGDKLYKTHTLNFGKIKFKHLNDYGHVHYLVQSLSAE